MAALGFNDFTPYGQASGTSASRIQFTDDEYDTENGTDHTLFRQYSPAQSRWTRPDPSNGSYNLYDPQSFNRYAYLSNRPNNATDPLGLYTINNGGGCSICGAVGDFFVGLLKGLFSGGGGSDPQNPGYQTSNATFQNGTYYLSAVERFDPLSGYTYSVSAQLIFTPLNIPSADSSGPWIDALFTGDAARMLIGANNVVTKATYATAAAYGGAFSIPYGAATGSFVSSSITQGGILGPVAGRVFWTGGLAAAGKAVAIAKEEGGLTLEMTPVGQLLNNIAPTSNYLWNAASSAFASGAVGPVGVVQGSIIRLSSTWTTIEYPILAGKNAVNIIPFW